ncbi:MAG: AAA family ATPase [Actinomycetota bacterium]
MVAEPGLVAAGGPPLLALATRESVGALRAAVQSGARGFFVWPAERDPLLAAVGSLVAHRDDLERRARVVAVHAARGGAGCTFVASHLAAALTRRGSSVVLVDADLDYADLTHALGVSNEDGPTIADLGPVAEELTWPHVQEVLRRGALLAPSAEARRQVDAGLLSRGVEVAATGADAVVVHLPRALDETTTALVASADLLLEVVTLDVLAFRATTRALEAFGRDDAAIVVNRAGRGEITVGDVARVFGADPLAVVPVDPAVPRAQDHGRILPGKGRTARIFDRLAAAAMRPVEPPERADVPARAAS